MDVEATLAALERRLDELQADLEGGQILKLSTGAERARSRSDPWRIVLEAHVDIHALSAFERALTASPLVRTVELRAYAAGWASLLVDVS